VRPGNPGRWTQAAATSSDFDDGRGNNTSANDLSGHMPCPEKSMGAHTIQGRRVAGAGCRPV
jgi:hypothetical protein